MCARVAIVYNEPAASRYDAAGEEKAVAGVLGAVAAVRRALAELGYEVTLLPLLPPLETAPDKLADLKADVVFNLFEGFGGRPETEALVAKALAGTGLPLTGCPAAALELCLDKAMVKVLLRAAGIATPDFQLLRPETLHTFRLGYPCIVKPRGEDASHGIGPASVAGDAGALAAQVGLVGGRYGNALVEEFVTGREFNATVMGNAPDAVLPVSEITYALPAALPRILTYAAKWEPDSPYYRGTQVACPAPVTDEESREIRALALAAYRLTGCRGCARVDMRRDGAGRLHVIEVNPNPDISPDAGAARQAAAAGMSYTGFIERIVSLALEKEEDDCQHSPPAGRGQAGPDANTPGYARVQTV